MKDPHYGRTGDAIYEEGLVYQEAAERFSKPEYFKNAVAKFRLLTKDYGGNRNCPDALVRLAELYSKHLNDDASAEDAYRRLHSQYGYSEKAIQKLRAASAPKPQALPSSEPIAQAPKPVAEPLADSRSQAAATVNNIRFWSTPEYTRVIVDMDSEAKYQQNHLSNPDRIYFDIANSKLSAELKNHSFTLQDEILKQVRIGQYTSDTVRIVLDTSGSDGVTTSELHDPFRIVIDLRQKGVGAPPALSAASPSPRASEVPFQKRKPPPMAVTGLPSLPMPSSANKSEQPAQSQSKPIAPPVNPEPKPQAAVTEIAPTAAVETKPVQTRALSRAASVAKGNETEIEPPTAKTASIPNRDISTLPRQASPTSRGDRTLTRTLGLKVGRIVIDPGHGGHDFGTTGPGGLLEKDLVLALARSLKKLIEEQIGAEVVLTRDEDIFVPLEERTSIANQHKADLFISIHANSSRVHSISGVETYYLDFAKTDAEREIAARENSISDNNVRDLEGLIQKIAKADKSKESRELASIVQRRLYSGARQVLPQTHNRGVRSAPFIVLIGANMPSVLAEVAFISNPKDERLLKKDSIKQSIVKALFAGIDGYMKALGSDVVQNRPIQSQ